MRTTLLAVLTALCLSGCVTRTLAREQVLIAYKKGLRVGRVIGRDEVLYSLKSPDCFVQDVDELMTKNPRWDTEQGDK